MFSRCSIAVMIAAGALLAACSAVPDSVRALSAACPTDSSGALGKVNWKQAEHIRIRVRQGEYTPMVQHFVQGRPYVLSLVNGDTQTHYFSAPGFARAVLTDTLRPGGGKTGRDCVNTVTLKAGQTVTWRFIAAHDGRYTYYDNAFALLGGLIPSGTVVIDEPPAYLLEP
ncbi:cupredoxin domain-containing protein [Varunaivibrio sulfuroxidans]|uniref:Plastocyanin n=1 Tax=Varunaivibrio sulfuroxidans TaxID=1773489 RepID=A0A4R3JJH7_9PROT|nr:hypothetical protein [Varunaivibrio sulfuroxidans]TCS65030.1 hypothetical protein EDD55_101364 [Varunaivibrio sulfuroxidans]WES29680.1 hypothetical protein P3M64_08445 [Varunaivibrio sulfuroxidans]